MREASHDQSLRLAMLGAGLARAARTTVGEFVPGYEASGWNGILAAKNTPADIIAWLNTVANATLAEPGIETRPAGLGATPLSGSPTDFEKLIAGETNKWGKSPARFTASPSSGNASS